MSNLKGKKIKGKTKSGFEYSLDVERLENYEVIEAIAELNEDISAMPKLLNLILGEEQKKKLLDHLRDKEGIVKVSKLETEIFEIFNSAKELKN